MPRLPQPGADNGTWGNILNEYLSQSLSPSGELMPDSVGATQLKANSVTNAAIAPNTITNAEIANNAVNATSIADESITEILLDSSVQAKLNKVAGDVSGPSSAVDNSVARFDSTTGKLMQSSGVTISDNNEIGIGKASNGGYSISTSNPIELVSTSPLGYETTVYGNGGQNVFKRANGVIGSPTGVGSGDSLGALSFRGYNGTSFTGSKAYIYAVANQTWTDTANGTYISIQTTPNNSTTLQTVALFSSAGQLQLPVQGSSAGILIGGDTNLYRSAADTLRTDDSLTVGTSIVLPQSATTVLYNTSDQSTNYERGKLYWSSNILTLGTEIGGTGTVRAVQLMSGTNTFKVNTTGQASGGGIYQFPTGSSNTTGLGINVTGSWSPASGSSIVTAIQPTINQSGTASYTAFLINPTETTTGSGTKLLADFQLAGTSKTRIDTTGSHILSSNAAVTTYNTTDETTNYERGKLYWNSNVLTLTSEAGGTGTVRNLEVSSAGNKIVLSNANSTKVNLIGSSNSSTGVQVAVTGSLTSSSGTPTSLSVSTTINQSGTAGYTALLVNPTETATGSGTKLLADFQVGGVSKAKIDNTGVITAAAGTATGNVVTVDGTQTLTNKTISGLNLSGDISLPQSSTLQLFNTTDQTTNYERGRLFWASNILTLATESGGTGASNRVIQIKASSVTFTIRGSGASNAGLYQFSNGTSATDGHGVRISGTFTPTAGRTVSLSVEPTFNQSGTAGYTALLVNPTETAAGTGAKLLADFQLGSVSKAKIDTAGNTTIASLTQSYTPISSTYTIGASDSLVDCTTGSFTVTLPTAVGIAGREYTIKNSGTGSITLMTTSSQFIDGSSSYLLSVQYKYVKVVSNGTNWLITANN